MKVEQAKQIASNAIAQLRQALEAGHSQRLKEYLAAMARFRRYSWGNIMLIASQKPNATHLAGFHAWHKLGRFVKKGEKGILILAPIIRKKTENNGEAEPDESSVAVGFRAAYVFDISQTDGQPLPEIGSVNGDPREYRERLAKFVAEQAIALEYSDEIAPARGMSQGGRITLLPGQSPAEEFATLAHETAHLCGDEIYVALGARACGKQADLPEQAPHNFAQRLCRNSITPGLLRQIFFGDVGLPVSHAANALAFISRSTSA
jgi:antirestriction protein ArdC